MKEDNLESRLKNIKHNIKRVNGKNKDNETTHAIGIRFKENIKTKNKNKKGEKKCRLK